MTHLYLVAPLVILGALLNRHRGGWLGTGHTQLARLDFAAGTALLWLLASWGDWRGAFVVIPFTFLGCLAGQGVDQADNTLLKALGLAGSGAINFAGIGLAAWWFHCGHIVQLSPSMWAACGHNGFPLAWPLVALGKPLAYRLGKHLPGNWLPFLFGQGFARGSTEWGEALFGAVEGFGLLACAALHFTI